MRYLILTSLLLVLAACNINAPVQTPTVEVISTETATPDDSPTPSITPSPSQTATITPEATSDIPVIIATVAPQPTAGPTLITAIPSPTPTPWVHVVQANETLGYIIQLQPWGYPYSLDVMQAVVEANESMTSIDLLPPPGSEIIIPFRTATPVPEGLDLTLTVDAELGGGQRVGEVVLPQGSEVDCHTVTAGQTMLEIRDLYDTTLEVMSQLNQNVNWTGCNFSQFSGGPGCNPIIFEGQCINVPLPTPVPSSTPTPSGNETATPTPTYAPPRAVFPPEGAVAPPGVFTLQWVSVGTLTENEVYLVEVRDTTVEDTVWRQVTDSTAIRLPASLIPADGQTHRMEWRVTVARPDESGTYNYISGQGPWRTFQWQSR